MNKHANVLHSGRSLIWVLCHRHNSLWSRKPLGSRVSPGPTGGYLPRNACGRFLGPWGSKWEPRQCPRSSRNSWWMLYAQVEQPTKNGSDSDILWPSMIIDLKICHPNSIKIRARSKDRKVLRFKGYWDDHTKYGARLYFNIHYYLADNTMEFNEVCDCGFPLRCTVGCDMITGNIKQDLNSTNWFERHF